MGIKPLIEPWPFDHEVQIGMTPMIASEAPSDRRTFGRFISGVPLMKPSQEVLERAS